MIIDALDECDNRRQLVQLFFSLTKAGAKVLVTSRTIPDLAEAFKACGQLEIRASDIDLKAYILYQLDQLDEDLKDCLPVGLRASLCSTILERSSGLYVFSPYLLLVIDVLQVLTLQPYHARSAILLQYRTGLEVIAQSPL